MEDMLLQLEREVDAERRRRYLEKYGYLSKDKKLKDFGSFQEEVQKNN